MTAILNLAVALLAGLLMTRIFSRWHLPDVTAFLVTGVLIGPFVLGRLGIPGLGFASYDQVEALSMISDVAMGFIAFAIGNEFRLEDLRKTGRQAFIIGIVQALVATVLVDLALLGFHFLRPDILSAPAAITLGAIAAATAPAATLMVVRQYKAKGPLTSLLLPIVALDDAVGLVVFAVSFGIAKAMISGALSIVSVLVNPLIEIVLSLLLGMLAGAALTRLEAMFHSNRNRMSMTIAFVFLTVALAALEWRVGEVVIGFSPLLVCMMLGTVFCNICPLSEDLMDRADDWSAPLLAVFFVISGAELRLEVFGERGRLLGDSVIGQVDGGTIDAIFLTEQGGYNAQQDHAGAERTELHTEFGDMYAREIESFSNSILTGSPLEVPASDAVQVQRVIELAYRSNDEKKLFDL